MWAIDWSAWLPIGLWAYLSPVFGPELPLFPLFPWSAFILIGVALGQLYARWGGREPGRLHAPRADRARRRSSWPPATAWRCIRTELFAGGARSLLPVDMAIRAGACLLILGAIALGQPAI